ncbi:MAG: preprotein translocase subunit SecG [Candidatus Acidiferrales bacterium]|jgi:preprotein translocase subunit SecG
MPLEAKWGISLVIGGLLVALGWRYTPVLVAVHIMVCFVLILVIMLQSGSAADLAGAFGGAGSQTAFGPRGAATLLSKATTWCAIMFMVTSFTLSVKRSPEDADVSGGSSSVLEQTQKSAPANAKPAPAKPAVPPPGQNSAPVNAPVQAPPPAPAPAPAQKPPQK